MKEMASLASLCALRERPDLCSHFPIQEISPQPVSRPVGSKAASSLSKGLSPGLGC